VALSSSDPNKNISNYDMSQSLVFSSLPKTKQTSQSHAHLHVLGDIPSKPKNCYTGEYWDLQGGERKLDF
jgi:hypothetical protein